MERAFLEELIADEAVVDAILQEHQRTVSDVRYQHTLSAAVERAGGRNLTAIRALLDESALMGAEDVDKAVKDAVAQLKKEHGYLFRTASQPYAAGETVGAKSYGMEDLAGMSMAEYRRFRGR